MSDRIDTGGGAAAQGNVQAGAGFTGRDEVMARAGDVHLTLSQIADIDRRQLDRMERLANDVADLKRAMVGDERYGDVGIIRQVVAIRESDRRRERAHLINTFILSAVAVGQLIHTIAIWYLYKVVWGVL